MKLTYSLPDKIFFWLDPTPPQKTNAVGLTTKLRKILNDLDTWRIVLVHRLIINLNIRVNERGYRGSKGVSIINIH